MFTDLTRTLKVLAFVSFAATAEAQAGVVAPAVIEAAAQAAMNAIAGFQAGTAVTIVNNTSTPVYFVGNELKVLSGDLTMPISTDYIAPGQVASMAISGTISTFGTTAAVGKLVQIDADGAGTNATIVFGFSSGVQVPFQSANNCSAVYAPVPDPQFDTVSCSIGQGNKADLRVYISPLF
jgi:hypothetical protein